MVGGLVFFSAGVAFSLVTSTTLALGLVKGPKLQTATYSSGSVSRSQLVLTWTGLLMGTGGEAMESVAAVA